MKIKAMCHLKKTTQTNKRTTFVTVGVLKNSRCSLEVFVWQVRELFWMNAGFVTE